MTSNKESSNGGHLALYKRLGGKSVVDMLVSTLIDELNEHEVISRFFRDVSATALRVHQLKVFNIILGGPFSNKDEAQHLDRFFITTHARLFRDHGLNEDHFDMFVGCFEQSLRTNCSDSYTRRDCISELRKLRTIFEQAAQGTTTSTVTTDCAITPIPIFVRKGKMVPKSSDVDVPLWLIANLNSTKKYATQVRKYSVKHWAKELMTRFEEDTIVSDRFFAMSYVEHYPYLVHFLLVAFSFAAGSEASTEIANSSLQKVKNPPMHALTFDGLPIENAISLRIWKHMAKHLYDVCRLFNLTDALKQSVKTALIEAGSEFADVEFVEVGGRTAPNRLFANTEIGIKPQLCNEMPSKKPVGPSRLNRRFTRGLSSWNLSSPTLLSSDSNFVVNDSVEDQSSITNVSSVISASHRSSETKLTQTMPASRAAQSNAIPDEITNFSKHSKSSKVTKDMMLDEFAADDMEHMKLSASTKFGNDYYSAQTRAMAFFNSLKREKNRQRKNGASNAAA